VKIALRFCALDDNAAPKLARTVVAMVDFLFTLGQIASALFLVYGGILVLMPAKKARRVSSDEMRVMHLRMHA
jgi:hypothetical protein